MSRLGTETAFEVLAKARALEAQGREIIHLEIGEPDFDTPSNIIEAAGTALIEGYTHYCPSAGIPELRQTIAEYTSETRGVDVSPEQVVVTPGAKPIMFFAILALIEAGDEVLYPNPGFPIYESMINFVGAKAIPLVLEEEREFRFDIAQLEEKISPRTKMIIINTPQNPTGAVLTRNDLEAIAEVVKDHDLMVLSDEVYECILYEGEHVSFLSVPGVQERTILLNGFSKTYAMTGWRLGFGVMPEELAVHITRLMTNSNSCTATFTQWAGIEALRGPQDSVREMVEEFERRRDVIVPGLNAIEGIRCNNPKGAFYVFPNIEGTGMNEREFADYMMEEAGVAMLAGTSFGEYGRGFVRLSYANSVENIRKALVNIEEALSRR
ncbi:MAG: aminotransferase class I/II-fold pyridoxal phosphate-dependent enzyme [Anaerolineae bacterium]|nr:aminotransferase class I/II-fold pyridoxal phosphate-dependent enzyme [Anaerolineae bacterium]NIN95287.1 aminotransferase class I/II-fold pyridoxal phosphate-dependent enzyme [Anaerolineae bacterium]NIQ78252.1 aminotransferase class I/II-fold pyridoxal phosphate-dependent enzyme [Anaerolineae bacterium]